MLASGKLSELKKYNKDTVLAIIKKHGIVTRKTISDESNISHTTVRKVLLELLEENKIKTVGVEKSTGGRKPKRYKIAEDNRYVFIAYLYEDIIVYNIANNNGEIVVGGEACKNIGEEVDVLKDIVNKLKKTYENIATIGLIVENNNSLGESTSKILEENLGVKVSWEYARNLKLLGYLEKNYSIKSNERVVYIDYSKLGLYSSLMVNGKLISSENKDLGDLSKLILKGGKKKIEDILEIINLLLNPTLILFESDLIDTKKLKGFNKIIKIEDENLALLGAIKIF